MTFDFSRYPLQDGAFSRQPMTLLDPEPRATLSAITEIALLETGGRAARERWQHAQLANLLRHAAERSPFWRARLGTRPPSGIDLAALPVLTRQDLRHQVATEGALLGPGDRLQTKPHASSGSSGVPVRFFVSDFNARYNAVRHLAQYFLEGRDLSLNRTRLGHVHEPAKKGFTVERHPAWVGPLAPLVKSGSNKSIEFFFLTKEECQQFIEEIKKDEIGYLVSSPRTIDMLWSASDLDFLAEADAAMWISLAENVGPHLAEAFSALGIPIRANYSSEETGVIGAECSKFSGYYHVATSNVMVEVVDRTHDLDGVLVGKVLVTHLHSYATPFIRYDIGDLGCLSEKCPCGHDGPVVHNLQGRASSVLKHRDGRLSPFHVRGRVVISHVDCTEFRIAQTAFDRIVAEFGGRSELSPDEIAAVTSVLQSLAGPEFAIEVRACPEIDWGESRKRPGFRCEI